MKKLFAMMLALCLLCGAGALAEEVNTVTGNGDANTKVSYTVAPVEEFTVTIPASMNLALTDVQGSQALKGTLQCSLDASKINTAFAIDVKLTGAANGSSNENTYYLAKDAEKVPYTLFSGDRDNPSAMYPARLGTALLHWAFGTTEETTASCVMMAIADPEAFKAAGEYTDTLTFTITGSAPEAETQPQPETP